jgi:hypothetical protein
MSKLGSRAFFSFSCLTDQTKHRDYSAWHGLDHLPENLALDGVALGSRWVRSPACADLTAATSDELGQTQYLTTYWFREPAEASIREWDELASISRHWGRRPELGWTKRLRRGIFVPIKGYADPAALVPADVVPFRPTWGVYVRASQFAGPVVPVVDTLRWYDEVRIPDLVSCAGAAGAWTFVSEDTFLQDRKSAEMTSFRVTLIYLDDDPARFVADMAAHADQWRDQSRLRDQAEVETVLLEGPLETVIPWRWDWFDV